MFLLRFWIEISVEMFFFVHVHVLQRSSTQKIAYDVLIRKLMFVAQKDIKKINAMVGF